MLKVAYDGTDFHGWQTQKDTRTVQGTMAQAWQALTGSHQYPEGSGRTDAGVHASGQIASFRIHQNSIPLERYPLALNSYLPKDIRVLSSCFAEDSFDVRRSASSRLYHYHLRVGTYMLPQHARYTLLLHRKPLLLPRLNELAALFLGRQDFTAFCSTHDQSRNKIRTVKLASFFSTHHGQVCFQIRANAFLMNMVRSILGNIIFFHDRADGVQRICDALVSGNKKNLGATVSAVGLSLAHVEYPHFKI